MRSGPHPGDWPDVIGSSICGPDVFNSEMVSVLPAIQFLAAEDREMVT
jgi:hypothetical protein